MSASSRARRLRATAVTFLLVLTLLLAAMSPAAAQLPSGFTDPTVEHEVLVSGLRDPTGLEVLPDGRVLWIHREGKVKIWKQDGTVVEAAKVPVDAYDRQQIPGGQHGAGATCPRGEECPVGFEMAEGGIHGIVLDPDFASNGYVYLYYTVVGSLGSPVTPSKMPGARGPDSTEGKFRLSRFTLVGDTLDLSTEVPLFENPAEWFHCCHYGGALEWLSDGTLVMTVGDDTISDLSNGYSPHDTRAGMEFNNADATSQNLADRRGKVLRIDVRDVDGDGSMVPKDNPFLDVPGADPYVYAYGFRSNYRLAVDPDTDALYVATVGPDNSSASTTRGPAAHEEIEVVPPGGGTNHGWPRCIANNIPYNQYDFETGQAGAPFSCEGMTPAAIWYTYRPSQTSPYVLTGQGGNTVMAGTVYDRPDTGALRLPVTYDNQLLWMEFARDQIWRSPVNTDGTLDNDVTDMLPVIYSGINGPIDSDIGPDGALYLVEYGGGVWNNTNGRISRLKCRGCTPSSADYGGAPVVDPSAPTTVAGVVTADAGMAATPLTAVSVLVGLLGLWVVRRRRSIV